MKIVNVPLPPEIHEALKERAQRSRRSLRSEAAILLAELVASDPMTRIRLPSDRRGICS